MSDPFWRIGAGGPGQRPSRAGSGRDALFSDLRPSPLRLRCQRCGTEARPRALDLLRGAPWLVAPRVRYPLRGRCPVCRRRAWLGVRAGGRSSSAG